MSRSGTSELEWGQIAISTVGRLQVGRCSRKLPNVLDASPAYLDDGQVESKILMTR